MNIVVVDCSVVVPWFFPEEAPAVTASLYKGIERATVGCIAPELLRPEFANVAWKKYRRGLCSAQQAQIQTELFLRLPIEFVESVPLMPEAVSLACANALPVYDCLYLAVAKVGRVALATLDEKLAVAARNAGVPLWE